MLVKLNQKNKQHHDQVTRRFSIQLPEDLRMFCITSGVRDPGVLSPWYFDELSVRVVREIVVVPVAALREPAFLFLRLGLLTASSL